MESDSVRICSTPPPLPLPSTRAIVSARKTGVTNVRGVRTWYSERVHWPLLLHIGLKNMSVQRRPRRRTGHELELLLFYCRDWNRDRGLYALIQSRWTKFTRDRQVPRKFSFRVIGSENTTRNRCFNSHYKIFCCFMVSIRAVSVLACGACFWRPTFWPNIKSK